MRIAATLLVAASLAGSLPAGAAEPNLVIAAGGQMRIQLAIPTDDDVDMTVPVTGGRIEIAPMLFVPGLLGRFWLNAMSLTFADFVIDRRPFGARAFQAPGAHLRNAVSIVALEAQPGVYTFTLVPQDLEIFAAAVVNGTEIEEGSEQPSENVTGIIDLNAKKFSARVVIQKQQTLLGVDVGGPLTITIQGDIAPDTDRDGVTDGRDTCPLVPNPPIQVGLGQWQQTPVPTPVVTPPPSLTVHTCAVLPFGAATAVDPCRGLWTTLAHDAPATWQPGTNVVTWSASTPDGASGSAAQQIRVTDRTPPGFPVPPPPITILACHASTLPRPAVADDCDGSNVVLTHNLPPAPLPGRVTVTWTAKDRVGNTATASQIVTVKACGG
jgi:hypothetical protein